MCNETNTYLEVYRSLTEEQACERTFVDAHPAALCFTTDTNRIVFGGKVFFANRSVYYCEIDDLAEHCSLKTVKRNCGTYRVIDHDNNFSASLIQYFVSHGRKVVQIYVHYQEGGAVCEVRTCSVNEDNVCGIFGPWQLVNRTIEGLAIDSHLDETSANAVQNAAVTKEIRGFEERVEEELGNAAAEMAGALHQVDEKIKDADMAIDKANASGEQAMASAKYALEKAGEAAMAAHDADEASKSATAASKSAMSARDLALSAYSNALDAGRVAFDTANSAKAAEAKREDAEAARISAEKRREENEEYRYNGFSRIQSGFAQITDTFDEALMATGQAIGKAETAADAATQAAESANVAVEEVKKTLAEGGKVELRPVASLPLLSDAERGVIYLLPVADIDDEGNLFDEFIVVNGKWERFGTGHIDMTGYATKGMLDQELANKQDKLTTYHETPFGAKMSSTDNQMSVSLGSGVVLLTNRAGDDEHKIEIDKNGVYLDGTDVNTFVHSLVGESVVDPNTGEPTFAIVGASGGDSKSVIVPVARMLTDESGTSYQYGVMSGTTLKMLYDSAAEIESLKQRAAELENVTRRGTMEVWHTIIDYTKRFDVRATGSTVVARFSVNPYNPKPQHQFIIPSYEVTDGVKVRMKICSDAACTNVIAEEGKMVEFAAGTFVYVKYDLYYNSSVLGMKVKFAAKDNYGDYVGEKIETLSPVTLFCESDYVTPMSGDIKVHCLGGMLTAAGKKFGSDYRSLSKLTIDGVPPSGSGNISSVNVGNDFVIHVNASADNLGDTINIRVENAALDVLVSNDTSPEYVDGADYYTKAEVDQKVGEIEESIGDIDSALSHIIGGN